MLFPWPYPRVRLSGDILSDFWVISVFIQLVHYEFILKCPKLTKDSQAPQVGHVMVDLLKQSINAWLSKMARQLCDTCIICRGRSESHQQLLWMVQTILARESKEQAARSAAPGMERELGTKKKTLVSNVASNNSWTVSYMLLYCTVLSGLLR